MMPLAFTPLFDPLPAIFPGMDDYWLLLVIPLVIAISVVYKGTRIKNLRTLPREATVMTTQILVLMVVAATALWGLYWVAVRVL
jgi:hypothetical protein